MITTLDCFKEMIVAPARSIGARVELYEGSTLLDIFSHSDALKSFSIERMGEDGKFFGFGVCQKLQATILDKDKAIEIKKDNYLEVEFGVGCEYMYPYPLFRVDDVKRDDNTNDITIIAYDPIYDSAKHKISEIELSSYSILDLTTACAAILGLPLKIDPAATSSFMTYYPEGANFNGSETLREVLNAISEATQTIYFVNYNWELEFKRLSHFAVTTIDKSKYFTLESKTDRTISAICHATELGDNVVAGYDYGVTQYVRNNPFWEMRDDIATLTQNAAEVMAGISIHQFNCEWRGDFSLEIGDGIFLTTDEEKDESIFGYVLNDIVYYNGGLRETTAWVYTDRDAEDAANPTSLGDVLNQTYAKVDKANREIILLASEAEATSQRVAALEINTESINASVTSVENKVIENINGINGTIDTLTKQVKATMTSEAVNIAISEAVEQGSKKVVTETGFTFDNEGLTISKSDSEMETQITEDGMTVYKNDEAVLTANNVGVNAVNLHANTYLIIGNNSRIEDYGSDRTGCFWIGG